MKKLITYLILLLTALWLAGCDKPAPTELYDDSADEQADYEILGKDYTDEYNSNGSDTTGVTQDLNSLTNLISISGIKETDINGNTLQYSFAQAVFFDRSKEVRDVNGRLLGYNTITPGIIKFDDKLARTVSFTIYYRENGVLKQTTLGDKYILFSGRRGHGDDFHFRHNSNMPFRLTFQNGQSVNFDIATPSEITGTLNILGSRIQKNLKASLIWNRGNTQNITIIISARVRYRLIIMPLYRVRTRDDGKLIIPERYINSIPFDYFDRLVFTFIRRFEKTNDNGENTLTVSSQSIHSIVVELP
jgi:hypothetical protein